MSEKNRTASPAPAIDLAGLNDRQRRIAETLDDPLFVEAGAGSGKTFTLTQRIAWALAPGSGEGGEPFLEGLDQVLVITFTEAAAREIKERVRSTLRSAGMGEAALAVDDAWISTIHGMCSRILRAEALQVGVDPGFSVLEGKEHKIMLNHYQQKAGRSAKSISAITVLTEDVTEQLTVQYPGVKVFTLQAIYHKN